ncbi:MAG: hypothetical protein ABI474_09920 [Actinomycetota bacterium]
MNHIQSFQSLTANVAASITVASHRLLGRLERRADRERGDVPGWVLITLMTAGLVTILWSLAATQLTALFTRAMNSVTGP